MPSTIIKEAEPLLTTRTPSRSNSLDASSISIYNKNWRYGYIFVVCIGLLAFETAMWRKYIAPLCGSYCNLNMNKEASYFKLAQEGVLDYSKMKGLQYPAGVLYFYKALNFILKSIPLHEKVVKEAIPFALFFYFMFLSAYLMKRCRIPAGLLLFFVLPLGLLFQGQALSFILPEMLGMVILLQMLTALVSGYQKPAVFLLTVALSFDSITVLPLLPALMLCLMRTMGARCAMFWITLTVGGFVLVSGEYLLSNPSSYLSQVILLPRNNSWNPIVWLVHALEESFKMNLFTRDALENILNSAVPGIALQTIFQLAFINFRWLKRDGGIVGLLSKFIKSNRGHGIRPNPWTPRQTLTVIFESMLVSTLLRFPSLVHAEEFELLTVMTSGFFCVALADVVPMPALFGIFTFLAFPLSFLYRQFIVDQDIHFNPNLKDSLHFLPMLSLPISQLTVLILFKRRDVGSGPVKSPTPSTSSLSPLSNAAKGFLHHRRSSSLSRRKLVE